MARPSLAVGLPVHGAFWPLSEMHRVLDLARAADDAGVDRIAIPDHLVMGPNTDRYPYGSFGFPVDAPWLEPLSVLSAMAAVTERVRLATGVLIAPLRPAVLLAKIAATLDVLSRGRLDLGVGTGWQAEEYAAVQIDFARRGERLTDTVAACRALWSESPASFHSRTLSFEKIWCEPKPLQAGGVPVWFGGALHARNVRRIAALGVGWLPIAETEEGLAAGARTLRRAFSEQGRDPATLRVRATLAPVRSGSGRPDLARTLEAVPRLGASGATDFQVALRAFVDEPADAPGFLRELARRFEGVAAA